MSTFIVQSPTALLPRNRAGARIARLLAGVTLAASFAMNAHAVTLATLAPTSYDMPNGDGTASGGSNNYWDLNYTGSGATATDSAPLSGGLGDLTDGTIAAANWFDIENIAGTGPYVGWATQDPTIVFHFSTVADFHSVRIYFDDADGNGGVSAPAGVIINGSSFAVSDPAGSLPFFIDFDVSALAVSDVVSIQLLRNDIWVFASEFTFDATPVPLPAAAWLLVGGLPLLARRRRPAA